MNTVTGDLWECPTCEPLPAMAHGSSTRPRVPGEQRRSRLPLGLSWESALVLECGVPLLAPGPSANAGKAPDNDRGNRHMQKGETQLCASGDAVERSR
jgi:hypothetical protein